jgi:hypothetical protein
MLDQRIAAAITGKPNPTYELLVAAVGNLAAGGVDNALLEQMILDAAAGLDFSALGDANAVDAVLKDLLSRLAHIDGSPVKPATAEQAVVLLKGMYTEVGQAGESLNELVWGLAQKPGGPASVAQAVQAVWDGIAAAAGGGDLAAGLSPEQAQQIADAVGLSQGVVNILGGKPGGGGTLADVAAVFGNLGATFQTQIDAALAGLPDATNLQPLLDLLAVKPGATVADVEVVWQALSDGSVAVAQLLSVLSGKPVSANPTAADVQAGLPVLIQAIVKDELGDRVTALEAAALSGEGVSQAVVDSLLARLDALEAENVAMKAELAQKIGETDIAALREQAAFAVDETVRLEAQDAEIVAWVTEKYLDKEFFERWENSIVDLFSGVYTNHNDLAKLVQDVMNAMNGPTATVQSITEMFWLLNDLLTALVEATGIDFPGSK